MENIKILIINGPNINMLGMREPDIYGHTTYNELVNLIDEWCSAVQAVPTVKQSNHEGTLVDIIQDAYFDTFDGVIINPGAYTHYSYAIRDALAILKIPIIEVHISDVDNREGFRSVSVIRDVCTDVVKGYGIQGYKLAINKIADLCKKNS